MRTMLPSLRTVLLSAFVAVAVGAGIFFLFSPPPPSYAVAVLGVVAVVMTFVLPRRPSNLEKASWIAIASLLMVIEMLAIHHDREQQDNNFNSITSGLTTAINGINDTLKKADATLTTTRQVGTLAKENLGEVEGGVGFPMFLPMPPIEHNDDMWSVLVMTPGKPWQHGHIPTSEETEPLIDVTVDLSEIVQPDMTSMTVSAEAFESQFLPQHYNLGTIAVPEDRTAPFKLEAGKNYQLLIRTRRMIFAERIYFDRDEKAIGGWRTSECTSQRYTSYSQQTVTVGDKLIDGKCEN